MEELREARVRLPKGEACPAERQTWPLLRLPGRPGPTSEHNPVLAAVWQSTTLSPVSRASGLDF